jgi:hypothetical protein
VPEDFVDRPPAGVIRAIEWCDKFPDFLAEADVVLDFAVETGADGSESRQLTLRFQSK